MSSRKATPEELAARKHGIPSTYNLGCRCDSCRAREARRKAEGQRKRKQRLSEGRAEFTHGRYGYTNWGCRCEVCTQAHSKASAEPSARWHQRAQAKTAEQAKRHGQQWTGPELEVAARDDLSLVEIATLLGRTLGAVRQVRQRLKDDPMKIHVAGISRASQDAT